MANYQLNLTGEEINERLEAIGTKDDAAASDGSLFARTNELQTDLTQHSGRIQTAEEAIKKHDDKIAALQDKDSALDSRLTAAEKTVAQHTTNLTDVAKEVDDQGAAIKQLVTQVGEDETKISDNASAIAANASAIEKHTKQIDTLSEEATAQGNQIAANTDKIASHVEAISTLNEAVDGANYKIVDARLRLGATWDDFQFRIHGTGIKTTDEVRLYRNVSGRSRYISGGDDYSKKVKGWHELKFVSNRANEMVQVFPYLVAATDIIGKNNPRKDEVEVKVAVPFIPTWIDEEAQKTYIDRYDDHINRFFADFFLEVNPDGRWLFIRHGKNGKQIGPTSDGGDDVFANTARSVEWAIRIFRDGKPITDFLPWKWLVETTNDISAPMNIRESLDNLELKLSTVSASHTAGTKQSVTPTPTTDLPDISVATNEINPSYSKRYGQIRFSLYNLKTKSTSSQYVYLEPASADVAGLMTAEQYSQMEQDRAMVEELYAEVIKLKYQGQNVVVLDYDTSLYTGTTADFNGQTYELTGSRCVFDLGTKKTINTTTTAERNFLKAVTDIWYLPDGITSYANAFNPGSSNSNTLRVHCKIDMSQCTTCAYMFFNQTGLTSLDVSDWDVSKVTTFNYAFAITSIAKLDVSKWDVSSATSLLSLWATTNLDDPIDLSNWNTKNCTNFYGLFCNVNAVNLDVSNLDTSKATTMSAMFYSWSGTRGKTIVGLTNFDTSKVTTFRNMFAGLGNTTLDLSSFSLESATVVTGMFDVDLAKTQIVTLGPNFFNAPNLSAFDLSSLHLTAELKQSLIDCYDRKTAGQGTLTLKLPKFKVSGVAALTDEEKAAIEAKGYVLE